MRNEVREFSNYEKCIATSNRWLWHTAQCTQSLDHSIVIACQLSDIIDAYLDDKSDTVCTSEISCIPTSLFNWY